MTRSRFERSKSFYCMGSLTVLCVSSEASAREACSPRPQAFINVAAAVNPLSGAGVQRAGRLRADDPERRNFS